MWTGRVETVGVVRLPCRNILIRRSPGSPASDVSGDVLKRTPFGHSMSQPCRLSGEHRFSFCCCMDSKPIPIITTVVPSTTRVDGRTDLLFLESESALLASAICYRGASTCEYEMGGSWMS